MQKVDRSRTEYLAAKLTLERARAEQHLWKEMEQRGLRRADGWSIVEFTREASGGTEIVLRPLHLRLPSPPGMECVVGVVDDDGGVHARCEPGDVS